ncbi:MAG TPA: hypothetical protein VNH83_08170, partial [Bryobacteraceae bacterium]|nr:hypothetical protein [Bryobacteraceae bacterium]
MMHGGPANRRAHLHYALIGLGAAAYLYPFLRVLWRVGDEGTLVYGAQRVAEGAVPYRDFMEVMGPGTFYWLGLFFKIFGATWLVARAEVLFTGVATTLVLYWLARMLHPGSSRLTALLLTTITIPLWPATSHHWDSNLFALLSFAVFVAWLDNSRPWLLGTAGVLAGVTTLFMQQKGLLLLFSFLLILFVLRRKQPDFTLSVARLLAGYIGVVAAVVLAFYAAGALPQFVYANVAWPLANYSSVNAVPYGYGLREWFWNAWCGLLLSLFRPAVAYAMASVFAVPFLVVAALPALLLTLAVAGRTGACNRATLPYWIAGSALWISEIHRSDVTHLIYGSPLLLILCISLWQQRQNGFWRYSVRMLAVSVVLFAAFNVLVAQAARTQMVTRRGAVYTFANDTALEFLDRQTQPGEDVFVYPYYPMYYFLSGTTNPTRFSILLYHNNTDAQFQEVIAALERRKVRYVLWDTLVDGQNLKQWFPDYRQPPREKLMIEPYLNAHYDLIDIKNGFRVLQRKDTMVTRAQP